MGDDVPPDAREPVLFLVEPCKVRGCVLNPNLAVFCKEGLRQSGLLAADVVAHCVDFSLAGLAGEQLLQEGNELLARLTCSSLAYDLAGAVFSAANRLKMPLRLYSKPWLSARSGASGSMRSLRSSA